MNIIVGIALLVIGFVIGAVLERVALLGNLANEGFYLREDRTKPLGKGRYTIVSDVSREIENSGENYE